MDMIKSYGGPGENQQSTTTQGGCMIEFHTRKIVYNIFIFVGGLSVNTVPTAEVNKNPDIESYVN